MKSPRRASLDEIRGFYAKQMACASNSIDPRLERIFELVPREAFVPPGPWRVMIGDNYVDTPSDDPLYLYQNVLIALDPNKRVNNGEPLLHARWIGAVTPQADQTVTHIGAGTGYYSAILSMLVLPRGSLTAYEIDEELAEAARRNLEPFENATVIAGDAVSTAVPLSDVIYVNAGVFAPPEQWLNALRPAGRMIFPWRPAPTIGLAAIISRVAAGFSFEPVMAAWFIPCAGALVAAADDVAPDSDGAWRTRSVRFRRDEAPDKSATAIYRDIWFSADPLPN
jgi:protein-L-isoaspartate(D-aspartate) O-methyltransferase